MNRVLRPLLLLCLCALPAAAEDGVYREVYEALVQHENRLPGSRGFEASLTALETALKRAGLEPRRQTFNTMVPETRVCELKVDGIPVTPFSRWLPTAPCPSQQTARNSPAPWSTWVRARSRR